MTTGRGAYNILEHLCRLSVLCWPSHCLHIDVRRLLTVDVNGVLTQLSLTEIQLDSMDGLASSLDTTVEEYNPDCFILVYAVDDKDSFGECKIKRALSNIY